MKLMHKTQRGGVIEHTGPPVPPGQTAVLPVDENGFFEAPPQLGECLIRLLAPDVTEATQKKTARKEADN